jgi:hypothetical protein
LYSCRQGTSSISTDGLALAGESFPNTQAVLVDARYWTSAAHEIGHTYGLHTPSKFPWNGPGEEYEVALLDVVQTASCQRMQEIKEGICFMGSVPLTAQQRFTFKSRCRRPDGTLDAEVLRTAWIDPDDYLSLFRRFLK